MFKDFSKNEKWEDMFDNTTAELKRMSNYSGLTFEELFHIPHSFFLLIRRDSWIHQMRQSEEGQNLLKKLWRLQQTQMTEEDLQKIRERR